MSGATIAQCIIDAVAQLVRHSLSCIKLTPDNLGLPVTCGTFDISFYLLLGSNNFEQSHICSRNNNLPNRSMPGYGYSTKPTEIFECTYATILNDHNENAV